MAGATTRPTVRKVRDPEAAAIDTINKAMATLPNAESYAAVVAWFHRRHRPDPVLRAMQERGPALPPEED